MREAVSVQDQSMLAKRERVAAEAELVAKTAEGLALDAKVVADTRRTVDDGLRYQLLRAEAERLRRIADDLRWHAGHPQLDAIFVAHPDGRAEEVLQLRPDRLDDGNE